MTFEVRNKKLVFAATTVAAAMGIGVVMQSFGDSPVTSNQADALRTLEVEEITLTAAISASPAALAPAPPSHVVEMPQIETPEALPVPASATSPDLIAPDMPEASPCSIDMVAAAAPGAMVDIVLTAPCLGEERFVMHHNGMMFSALTDATGNANLVIPALSENAVFIASFSHGDGATVQQQVPDLPQYRRTVVQWRGETGLGLHALENDALYFSAGHVHADERGALVDLVSGTGGHLARFGGGTGADPLMAEVYSYPASRDVAGNRVALSVETEITASNCDKEVDAQTLEYGVGGQLRVQDVTLHMPDCDAVGDFLVLKNLVPDMTLAAN